MSMVKHLPSYQEQFGVTFLEGDPARSVYSPAAYFADLLQLLDDYFTNPDLLTRRNDLHDIPLDADNTFSLVPYLDIINTLLEGKVSDDNAFGTLQQAKYPFNLPFSLEDEKVKLYMQALGMDRAALYKLFHGRSEGATAENDNNDNGQSETSATKIARFYLGLSAAAAATITVPSAVESLPPHAAPAVEVRSALSAFYNNQPFAALEQATLFLKTTDLSIAELRELLSQSLSPEEAGFADRFFINKDLGGYVRLVIDNDIEQSRLAWITTGTPADASEPITSESESETDDDEETGSIPLAWFSRVNRLLRLSRQSGISLSDLDLILRVCCHYVLDAVALQRIAIVKHIADSRDLSIEEVCSFFGPVNALGQGKDATPTDLFNRVFNVGLAEVNHQYFQVSAVVPRAYASFEDGVALSLAGDLFSLGNVDVQKRLMRSLHLSQSDLKQMVTAFADNVPESSFPSDLHDQLSLYYRVSKLTQVLDLSMQDLFDLLDLLAQDPTIRQYSGFDPLIHLHTEALNAYQILASGSLEESLWLVQLLLAIADWMQANQYTPDELKQIQTGQYRSEKEAAAATQKNISGFNELYQQLKPVLLTPTYFRDKAPDAKTARILYRLLTAPEQGLVSEQDPRLLTSDRTGAQQALFQALSELQHISAEDFLELGISEKVQTKIFTDLILQGYLQPDGQLIESAWPSDESRFKLCENFDSEAVFKLIYKIYQTAAQVSEAGIVEELSIFPSDLEALNLEAANQTDVEATEVQISDAQIKELYDNLIYNGYIDEAGTVASPAFFSQLENSEQFQANTHVKNYQTDIYQLIASKAATFEASKCQLKAELFTALPLKEIEVVDLLENLHFNDYIDAEGYVLNKAELLALPVSDFKLVLAYYPYRHQILSIVQTHLQALKEEHFAIAPSDFAQLGRQIVANDLYNWLAERYLQVEENAEGKGETVRFTSESIDFFTNEDELTAATEAGLAGLNFPPYFDRGAQTIALKAIQEAIALFQTYRLHPGSFIELGLTTEEEADLLELLADRAYISQAGTLTPEQVDYFLNVNNALDIALPAYEDFAKDIFFTVHTLAKHINETVQALLAHYSALAQQQEEILFAGLQAIFEIPTDLVKVICRYVFSSTEDLVTAFAVPLLAAVSPADKIIHSPGSYRFKVAFNRIQQFAWLATKLDLSAIETDIIFRDQNLADKFSEKLSLPEGVSRIDCLFETWVERQVFPSLHPAEDNSENSSADTSSIQKVLLLYSADKQEYWLYDLADYQLLTKAESDLTKLSELFANLPRINAAFNDTEGNAWIISGTTFFCQARGQAVWTQKEKVLGRVNSQFSAADRIEAAFVDRDKKLYLFAANQYLRSSTEGFDIDEGYPKRVKENWAQEHSLPLPAKYTHSLDAAISSPDETLYFFKGEQFVSSEDFDQEREIRDVWGKVRNNFAGLSALDAAIALGSKVYFFSGDQCLTWSYSLENEQGLADEGSLQSLSSLIPNLPDLFKDGIDTALLGSDNKLRLFKNGYVLTCQTDFQTGFQIEGDVTADLSQSWGNVRNQVTSSGEISAAFAGLDGHVYLFSGNQYVRYSSGNYAYVDEGYPRGIAGDWGGLDLVDAAFILDGKTYLIGLDNADNRAYVRYSTNDYSQPDEDYPKPAQANWWADHFNLDPTEAEDFTQPDTVFIGRDGVTYLFKGDRFISYDKLHRWWNQPQPIRDKWAGMTFDKVDAAFTGKDGRTYLFSGNSQEYLRYSDPHFNRLDDRYPQPVRSFWGRVKNNLVESNRIDATVTAGDQVYLFSGDQFYRFSGGNYAYVEQGYPKAIAPSLKHEPRFANITAEIENTIKDGIDAAFADSRNVYLFKNEQCHVVSEVAYKRYDTVAPQPITAALADSGVLYLQVNGSWQTLKGLEQTVETESTVVAPPLLRAVPDAFEVPLQEGTASHISAAFTGADGSTYVFKGKACYNSSLEKAYLISEEWGRSRNNIAIDSRVDAAFVGTDGKTYLFSGDQFVSYTPAADSATIPDYIDAHPQPIQEHWGGLNNVDVAFVRDGKTYLLEAPDDYGKFRYLCYSSSDYSQPDSEPSYADLSWWEFPSIYLEEGFDRVDAVLFDDEHMFLFKEDQFIQFNSVEGLWTYPRSINRIWRQFPLTEEMGNSVVAAFKGQDGKTYFFSDRTVTSTTSTATALTSSATPAFTPPEPIRQRWGKLRNNILDNGTVDAAVVVEGSENNRLTYLFSGDQYVRYSTADYRFVDAGYPKAIAQHLRQEESFTHLPETLDLQLSDPAGGISGIIAQGRSIYLFEGRHCHVSARQLTGTFSTHHLGQLKNTLQTSGKVDAAFINNNQQTYLFSGDQYVRYSPGSGYSLGQYHTVDEGYPKAIATQFPSEHFSQNAPASVRNQLSARLAADFNQGKSLDAATQLRSGDLYLFQGETVYMAGAQAVSWRSLQEFIPTPENAFASGVNAAFVATDGKAYFFDGSQFARYSSLDNEYVDEGYPKSIQDHWGNLPADFEASIESAFVFEGKTYLIKGDQYVRYTGASYQLIDPIYPQAFAFRWGHWSDYLLSDIHTITAFKSLLDNSLSQQYSLSNLLNLELGYKKEPYRMLADIFDWDIDEIKWLKRRNAFYEDSTSLEVNFNIELILRMAAIFKLADKAGTTPTSLYALAHQDATENLRPVAQTLYAWLKLKHSEKDWEILSAELHNTLNLIKRDGLLPYVIAKDDETDNARDLFAKMLVDVEMGNDAKTSRIKEAISALQLYFHRYFVNLELLTLNGDAERVQLKQWWQWMRNYRVWEANRKVFLYPENYIRPELRDTKTTAFQKLEEALLQGEVTPTLVNTAFNDYLNEFSTVGNLKITGANVYDGDGDRTDDRLVLFGHTRTEPAQYYYRTAQFLDRGSAIWGNWLPVNISVNSTRVFPIHAFGRILVFWTEIEAYEESVPFISTKNSKARGTEGSTSKVEDTDTVLKHRADIKYSFYDFNKQWVTPQTLQTGIELEYKIDAAYTDENKRLIVFSGEYCLISTIEHPQGDVKKISEVYTDPTLPAEEANKNLPSQFHQGIDAAVQLGDRLIFFKDSLCAVKTGDTWETHSIISYFRPQVPVIEYVLFNVLMWARYIIAAEFDNLYRWGIAAAFAVEGKVCLIDHQGMPLFFNPQANGSFLEEEIHHVETVVRGGVYRRHFSLINEYMRILTRNFMRLEPVDAVFEDENGIIYVVRKGQYECYQHDKNAANRLEKLDGFPKPIKGNLSFNMDKFFNRLHLAEMPGGEAISLTYASPEANVALLSGRVKDDFTFVPGDLRTDYQKHAIWKLSHGFLTVPGVTQLATTIRDEAAIRSEIDNAIAAANRDEALARQVPVLAERIMRVINSQEALNNSDDNDGESKFSVPVSVQREIYSLLEGGNGVIALVDNGPERWTFGQDLREAFEAYVSAPESNWTRPFAQLQQTRRSLRTTVSAEERQRRLVILQGTLERLSQTSLSQRQASSRQDIDDYQNIQALFNQRLIDIGPILSTFEPTANDDVIDRLPDIEQDVNELSGDIQGLRRMVSSWSALIKPAPNTVAEMRSQLQNVDTQLTNFNRALAALKEKIANRRETVNDLTIAVKDTAEQLREIYFGNLDSFPSSFGIANQTNFTFGEPDWHIFEAKGGTFLCKPETGPLVAGQKPYRIIRLTTTTIPTLSNHLFAGGPDRLLTVTAQQVQEKPDFSTSHADSDTIAFNGDLLSPPNSNNLDFNSANANYYWEIFFHVPSLIAQTLNRAQKFETAKHWYEYIFDPTAISPTNANGTSDPRWQFLPFIQAQQNAVTTTVADSLHRTLDIENLQAEIAVYLNDPFDPHAIARIREVAYQKATMMAYIDNLLDWGDMLFRQYSIESINEARMLYILAYDLLGTRPAALGHHQLPEARTYANLYNPTPGETDLLIDTAQTEFAIATGTVHQTVSRPYFFIPDNDRFLDYWNRVEDRLYKIRQSLNIDGVKQALPLFQPPIDPMSIVQAIAGGSSLSQITSGSLVPVPHYRFNFMFYKAKELVGRLNQFGGELLAAIEKRDAEQLGLLQHRQEATILSMVTKVKEAQIAEAEETIASLKAGLAMVEANEAYNQSTIDDGFLPYEIAQMSVMGAAVVSHAASAILRTIASFGGSAPDSLIGPFIAGIKVGGAQAYSSLSSASEVLQTVAEGLSIGGEIFGIVAQHERMMADIEHQVETAIHDKTQIQAQIAGAEQQLKIAEYELAIHQKEIEHHKSISTFMTSKFSNEQLYQWMSSQLAGLYYQSYKLAHDMAKSAEKAFQFERGVNASEVNFINGMYWNSQRKGLLAGDSLGLDLDRMEQAFIQSDSRRLEISKSISLLDLDPLALLQFKSKGTCEFELSEALFDYDFPGHYCRQIKTLEVSFDAAKGETVNATLTQLNNKTVLETNPKAVKYLLDPKGTEPLAIRSDWRVSEQIALSHVDEYEKSNGLFELRFDDDRYLPFEGTGAVSRWRLELNGKQGSVTLDELLDANIRIRYTALQGGEKFTDAVKGLLKPYDTVRFFDLNYDFHDQWLDFLATEETSLSLTLTRDRFPNMASSRITGIFSKFLLTEPGPVSLMLNNDETLILRDEQFLETPGLSVRNNGSTWTFTVQGDKTLLKTVQMVVGFKAKV